MQEQGAYCRSALSSRGLYNTGVLPSKCSFTGNLTPLPSSMKPMPRKAFSWDFGTALPSAPPGGGDSSGVPLLASTFLLNKLVQQ